MRPRRRQLDDKVLAGRARCQRGEQALFKDYVAMMSTMQR